MTPIYRLEIAHPDFPDYLIYSPPMDRTMARTETRRMVERNITAVVQEIHPALRVIGRIAVSDFR